MSSLPSLLKLLREALMAAAVTSSFVDSACCVVAVCVLNFLLGKCEPIVRPRESLVGRRIPSLPNSPFFGTLGSL